MMKLVFQELALHLSEMILWWRTNSQNVRFVIFSWWKFYFYQLVWYVANSGIHKQNSWSYLGTPCWYFYGTVVAFSWLFNFYKIYVGVEWGCKSSFLLLMNHPPSLILSFLARGGHFVSVFCHSFVTNSTTFMPSQLLLTPYCKL